MALQYLVILVNVMWSPL